MLKPELGIALFTDGSASYKDRSGGYAWIALDAFDGIAKLSGSSQDTTSNQMELQAAIDGLEYIHDLHGPTAIIIYSDSQYVVKGASDRQRKRRKNQTFWKRLDAAINTHAHVEFHHVRGHSGHQFNEMADELAGAARRAGIATRGQESE